MVILREAHKFEKTNKFKSLSPKKTGTFSQFSKSPNSLCCSSSLYCRIQLLAKLPSSTINGLLEYPYPSHQLAHQRHPHLLHSSHPPIPISSATINSTSATTATVTQATTVTTATSSALQAPSLSKAKLKFQKMIREYLDETKFTHVNTKSTITDDNLIEIREQYRIPDTYKLKAPLRNWPHVLSPWRLDNHAPYEAYKLLMHLFCFNQFGN